MPEYLIAGTLYPDAAHAAAAYGLAMDFDEAVTMFPDGLRGIREWIGYDHPHLTREDRNTLAAAVHDYCTRPDQDMPTSASLRRYLAHPVYSEATKVDTGLTQIPACWRQPAPKRRRLFNFLSR